jgi:hypothetical protein
MNDILIFIFGAAVGVVMYPVAKHGVAWIVYRIKR